MVLMVAEMSSSDLEDEEAKAVVDEAAGVDDDGAAAGCEHPANTDIDIKAESITAVFFFMVILLWLPAFPGDYLRLLPYH